MKLKKVLLGAVAILFLAACQTETKEDRANRLIEAEMLRTLGDISDYEPIGTTVDSAFTSILTDPQIRTYARIAMEAFQAQQMYEAAMNDRESDANLLLAAQKSLQIRHLINNFERKFIGYRATHRFRVRNDIGGSTLRNYVFIIDPNFEEIISVTDITVQQDDFEFLPMIIHYLTEADESVFKEIIESVQERQND